MTFRVGMKVVCIKGDAWRGYAFGDERFPQFANVYTIREIHADDGGCVRLVEIINPLHSYHGEGSLPTEARFRSRWFRPAVEDKKKVSFTMGADPESERWDGRRKKIKERT